MFNTFLAALSANALMIAALTYLVKIAFDHRLKKDLIDFQNNLQAKTNQQLDQYRAELEKERIRLQISYGGIFEKQANAILELYRAMVDLESSATDMMHMAGTADERKLHFTKSWRKVRSIHLSSRVLLPKSVDERISQFIDQMFRGALDYIRVESRDLSRVSENEFDRLCEKQDKAIDIIEREVPAIRDQLVDEMRSVMGVASGKLE